MEQLYRQGPGVTPSGYMCYSFLEPLYSFVQPEGAFSNMRPLPTGSLSMATS